MIRKDINKRLLVMIAVLLALLLFSIVFYEIRLWNIFSYYKKNFGLYGPQSSIFERLNRTSAIKETALTDKKYLEKRYVDLLGQNEKLTEKIESLKEELTLVKSQEEYQKARDGGPVEQFRLIQEKNTEIIRLKEDIRELCLKLSSYNITEKIC